MQNRRGNHRLGALLAAAALPLLMAGCGASSDSGSVTPQAPVSASATGSGTDLKIVVTDGAKTVSTWTLTCDPMGGTHPHPDKACAALAENGRTALPPVAKGMMCTMIFGGAQTATLSGTWAGKSVDSAFSRKNGCEISRWKALEGLLPAVANVPGGAS